MKIQRYQGNVLSPATNAQGQERTLFGSQSQGDDLDSNLNASLLRGWGIVGPNEHPTLQDFNGAMYTLGQFIAYLHQMGIPEWHTDQEFHTGSLTLRNGAIYVSQGDDNTGNDPATDDGTNWMGLPALSIAYDNTDSSLTAENVKAALDELDTAIQNLNAADIAYDNSDSTLTSGNTKAAIDELDGKVEGFNVPGTVIDTQTFPSPGSFTWNKPAEANADDTVVARIWAGGGSGYAQENSNPNLAGGGSGGGFLEVSLRASSLGSSESVEVGSGASSVSASGGSSSNGLDGDNSSFAGFAANGGNGGGSSGPAQSAGFTLPSNAETVFLPYKSGAGGDPTASGADLDGESVPYAGAGGGSTDNVTEGSGGASWKGGDGGAADIDNNTANGGDGQSPGGGGGAALIPGDGSTANSGAGGDGQVIVYVIRGWSPSGITAYIT